MTGLRGPVYSPVRTKMCVIFRTISRMGDTVKDGRAVKILAMPTHLVQETTQKIADS